MKVTFNESLPGDSPYDSKAFEAFLYCYCAKRDLALLLMSGEEFDLVCDLFNKATPDEIKECLLEYEVDKFLNQPDTDHS